MKTRNILEIFGNGIMYALSLTNTKEIFEIISLVISILISILIFVSHLVSWFKKAKQDGKIDNEELDQLIDIINETEKDLENKNKKEN